MERPTKCKQFREWIVHFQADEVPEERRESLQQHLNDCPDCSKYLEFEDQFLAAMRTRLRRTQAPPGLETRIRAQLAAQSQPRRVVEWFRQPWFVVAATSMLLAVVLIPALGNRIGVQSTEVVDQRVLVVDHDCERAGVRPERQRGCLHPKHLNALRLASGDYWQLSLDQDLGRRVLLDRDLRGRWLKVNGAYFPRIRTLQLADFEVVESTAAQVPTQGSELAANDRGRLRLHAHPRSSPVWTAGFEP